MDNRNHVIWKSRNLHRGISMAGVRSIADMTARVDQQAAKLRPGEVVVGNGAGPSPISRRSGCRPARSSTRPRPTIRSSSFTPAATTRPQRISLEISRHRLQHHRLGLVPDPARRQRSADRRAERRRAGLRGRPAHAAAGGPGGADQVAREQQRQHHALGLTGIRELVLSPWHMRTYSEMHRQGRLTLGVGMGVMLGVQHVDGGNPIQLEKYLTASRPCRGCATTCCSSTARSRKIEVTTRTRQRLESRALPARQQQSPASTSRAGRTASCSTRCTTGRTATHPSPADADVPRHREEAQPVRLPPGLPRLRRRRARLAPRRL